MRLARQRWLDIIVSSLPLLAAAPAVAHAQLVTRFTTYLHSGPGFEFTVTDEVRSRTPVSPDACKAGWCRINYGGVYGWIEQKMLIAGPSTAQPPPGARPTECMDFARTGWPDAGDLERVCIFKPNKPIALDKPAG